jgi:glycosyltransferase involved in cell wall biosynthesis
MSKRLGIFVTHPIQYFAPLWRRLASVPDLSVRVHFFSDHSVRGGVDPFFKVPVAWDRPLLDGYDHCFIHRDADLSRPFHVSLPDARAILRDGQFDWVMIHGYTYRFEIQLIRAARRLGVPVLLWGDLNEPRSHDGPKKWYVRMLRRTYLKWFYSHIHRFCYVGQMARQHLLRMGINEEQMFFCPRSVDSDFFEEQYRQLDREQCRRQLGIGGEQLVILFSGKFTPIKDPFVLLEAVARLEGKERVTLLMLGEGDLRERIQSRAREVLSDRAIFPGFVNQTQLGRYYRAADICVLPSISESWGLVINETMIFGLPAVVSKGVTCGPDLVLEGQTGFVFPVGSVEGLSASLQKFLNSPKLVRVMGTAAREHVRNYSLDATASGIVQALGLKI